MVASLEKSRHGPCSVYFRQLLGHSAAEELVWRTVHLQPNTHHPSPGSDDEAQSRPSRASRTRFCRPFPLSFPFMLRPTWTAALASCFVSKKHGLLMLPHTHSVLAKGAIQAAPGTVKRGPGKPHVSSSKGWSDPGSGAQPHPPPVICEHSILPSVPAQPLNAAIATGSKPGLWLSPLSFFCADPSSQHASPRATRRMASALVQNKRAQQRWPTPSAEAGGAPFGHPIRCGSATLLTLTGRGRPTCTANRGVEGRTLDVASESVAPALLSAVWGEGKEAPVRPTTALADQPPSFRSDGTCRCVCAAVDECVALGCVTVK